MSFDEYLLLYPAAEICSADTLSKLKMITKSNPKCGFQKGHTINDGSWTWNKGLTKESDDRIAKYAKNLTGREITEEHRKNLSASCMGRPGHVGKANGMFGRKMSEQEKEDRYDEIWYNLLIEGIQNSKRNYSLKKTNIEIEVEKFLILHDPGHWQFTGHRTFWVKFHAKRKKNPDFTSFKQKKIIEVFGSYWHQDPSEESYIVREYAKCGWECLVIWDHDLKHQYSTKIYEFLELDEYFTPLKLEDMCYGSGN